MARPHVLVIPYPAQGHANPLMHFAQMLANHGCKITFVNTDFNHERAVRAMSDSNIGGQEVSSCIHMVSIPDGMGPEDDRNDIGKLTDAILTTMPESFEKLLKDVNSDDMVSCIVADGFMGWTREVAEKMGIRMAVLWPASAALSCFMAYIPKLIQAGLVDSDGFLIKKQVLQLASRMPALDSADLPWKVGEDLASQKIIFKFLERVGSKESQLIDWQFCNSTYELEPGPFSLLPKLLPIGPLIANYNTARSGAQFWQEDTTCLQWLDQQPPRSVIYVAFGSLTMFDETQFQELALGLELAERPFLWVVRTGITKESNNVYPDGFQGTRGRTVEWVPQQNVLSHPAVACFVSHCGWNSTMEGLTNGVPFLCWPYFADQFPNKSYICDIWKVGLGFDKNEKGIITKEEFKGKVEKLINDDNICERSSKLKEIVRNSIAEGGQSSTNFNNFIQWLKQV